MQVGHKEGYLTKRGKNFGGWKTRFFVLQGPVLEYYDCVRVSIGGIGIKNVNLDVMLVHSAAVNTSAPFKSLEPKLLDNIGRTGQLRPMRKRSIATHSLLSRQRRDPEVITPGMSCVRKVTRSETTGWSSW
jgi:hypothetical protein